MEAAAELHTPLPPESSKLTIKPGDPFNPKKCLRLDGFPEAGVCDTQLSMGARLTLTLIWSLLNRKQGCAWPSTAYLSSKLGVTRQTVSGYLADLVEAQYIKVEKRRREGQQFASNVYVLLWRDGYKSLLRIGAEPQKHENAHSAGPEKPLQLEPCQDSPCQRQAVSAKPDIEHKDIVDRSNVNQHQRITTELLDERRNTRGVQRRAGPACEDKYRNKAWQSLDTDEESPDLQPTDHESVAHPVETLEPSSAPGNLGEQRHCLAETDWKPTTDDARKLLCVMQELTGGGDLAYAKACLADVRRGANNVEDIIAKVRQKSAGRRLKSNGYIRAIIRDHFGVSEAERQESENLAPRRMKQFKREMQEIDPLKRLGMEALRKYDLQGLSKVSDRLRAMSKNLSDLGKRQARSMLEFLEAGHESLQKELNQG